MPAAIPFIGPAISIGGALLGGKQKRTGLQQAGAGQSAFQNRLLDLQEQLLAEGQPVREAAGQAALGAFPLLSQDINRQAGTGVPFQRALETGTRNIFSSLAPYGLTDSSVAGRAVGELGSNLLGQDISQLRDARFRLAGMGPNTLGAATGLFPQIGQTFANQGNLALGQGIGGQSLLGDIGQTVGGLFGQGGAGTNLLTSLFQK